MQPLFIGPINVGAQRNLKPFMIPEDAFPNLLNAFVFRGRVERKFGYTLLGRLQLDFTSSSLGNSPASSTWSFNFYTTVVPNLTIANRTLVPGTVIITDGTDTFTDQGNGILKRGSDVTSTINYVTGAIVLHRTISTAIAFTATFSYNPNLPVMGLCRRELVTLNQFQTVAFDTRYAYRYVAGAWQQLPSTLPVTWNGADYQLFWSTNYAKDLSGNDLFWVSNDNPGLNGYAITLFSGSVAGPPSTTNITTSTANNFQVGDNVLILNPSGGAPNGTTGTVTVSGNPFTITNPGTGVFTDTAATGIVLNLSRQVTGVDTIKYYNGSTWSIFNPTIFSGTVPQIVLGALLIIPYKDRLVLLNTTEGTFTTSQNFQNRARWSQNGSPIDLVNGWLVDVVGRGGFVDAPTLEAIISCGFVKDVLVVYFERSTWQLVYTSNELLPFIWQRIDSELGAESTFSNVQFDNGLLAFGNVGIHSSNGVTCERIDAIIPDEVFTINNVNEGPQRVYAQRDFLNELAYFSYPEPLDEAPTTTSSFKFPNKVIVFNYRNNTWSFFRENFTCYGPFQLVTPGFEWQDMIAGTSWAPWSSWNQPWNSGFGLSGLPTVSAGSQQGFVVELSPDNVVNSDTLFITALAGNTVTSPNHNLQDNEFVVINNCIGSTNLNGLTCKVISITDSNNFVIDQTANGGYIGGGTMTLLSNINIQTKMFAPFWTAGLRYRLRQAEFLLDKTSEGEMTVDCFVDTSENYSTTSYDPNLGVNNAVLGTNIVSTAPEPNIPQQYQQNQIWQRMYFYTEGETFQMQFSLSDAEMKDPDIVNADIVLHGMIFHFEPAGEFL